MASKMALARRESCRTSRRFGLEPLLEVIQNVVKRVPSPQLLPMSSPNPVGIGLQISEQRPQSP